MRVGVGGNRSELELPAHWILASLIQTVCLQFLLYIDIASLSIDLDSDCLTGYDLLVTRYKWTSRGRRRKEKSKLHTS